VCTESIPYVLHEYFVRRDKVGREGNFTPISENTSLHEISNDNGGKVANFATFKSLSKVQYSHISIFINILGLLLMETQSD
jgi:hypothetical protein